MDEAIVFDNDDQLHNRALFSSNEFNEKQFEETFGTNSESTFD